MNTFCKYDKISALELLLYYVYIMFVSILVLLSEHIHFLYCVSNETMGWCPRDLARLRAVFPFCRGKSNIT